jgi:ERCC4-type nuclease
MEDVRVTVDTNAGEDDLHARLRALLGEERVFRRRLDVGDVLLEHPAHGALMVERKRWDDLAASLADGRWAEQKARQMAAAAEAPNLTVLHLVVGQLPGWHASWPPNSPAAGPAGRVECAVLGAAVGDGIPVLRALDGEAAAETLAALARKLGEGALDGAARAQRATAAGYAGLKTRKSANEDAGTTWQAMLAAVRGVSAPQAAALAARWPCAAALVAELAAAGRRSKGVKLLAAAQVSDKRKLGPKAASRLAEIFGPHE